MRALQMISADRVKLQAVVNGPRVRVVGRGTNTPFDLGPVIRLLPHRVASLRPSHHLRAPPLAHVGVRDPQHVFERAGVCGRVTINPPGMG